MGRDSELSHTPTWHWRSHAACMCVCACVRGCEYGCVHECGGWERTLNSLAIKDPRYAFSHATTWSRNKRPKLVQANSAPSSRHLAGQHSGAMKTGTIGLNWIGWYKCFPGVPCRQNFALSLDFKINRKLALKRPYLRPTARLPQPYHSQSPPLSKQASANFPVNQKAVVTALAPFILPSPAFTGLISACLNDPASLGCSLKHPTRLSW